MRSRNACFPHSVLRLPPRLVLLAWLVVVLVAGLAPWVRASQTVAVLWEPACTASGQTHWIPSPAVAADATAQAATGLALHLLDCPLCLPMHAPPATNAAWQPPTLRPGAVRPDLYRTPPVAAALALPQARAPPRTLQNIAA